MSLSFSIPLAIRMVGEAGQGIILMGSILAKSLVKEGYWVAQSQHYGAQVRGGVSYCDTLFDIEPIDYPLADHFDVLYLMHGIGSNNIEKLKRNSILFYDEKFVEKLPQHINRITRKIVKVPASRVALEELSNINVANMISLGVLCSVTQLVSEETRGWDSNKKETFPMRTKEEDTDYRYFPEPDLPPLILNDEFINHVRSTITEMPEEKAKRFMIQYDLPQYDAEILTSNKELSDFFEKCVIHAKDAKFVSNLIMTDLLREMKENEDEIENLKIKPEYFGELKELLDSNKISTKILKDIFPEIYKTGKSPKVIVQEKGLEQIDDESELRKIIEQIIIENPQEVEKYRNGKKKLLGFFVGEVMKKTKGKANPQKANEILLEFLEDK
jgi:Glu-tRNA(Gln) amidotransferase subunit E-like FAD-binding protein